MHNKILVITYYKWWNPKEGAFCFCSFSFDKMLILVFFLLFNNTNTLVVALMSAVDDATLPCESRCVVVVIVIPGNTITASKDLAQASYFLATNRLLGYSIKYNQQYLYTCDEPQKVMNFTLQNELMILRRVKPKFRFSEKFFDGFIYWNSKCILHCWTCNV